MANEKTLMFQIGIKEVKETIDSIRKKFDDFEKEYGNSGKGLSVKLDIKGATDQAETLINALKRIGNANDLKGYENEIANLKKKIEELGSASKGAGKETSAAIDKSAQSVNQASNTIDKLINRLKDARDASGRYSSQGFLTGRLDEYYDRLLKIKQELEIIKKNGGIHPESGLTASQVMSQSNMSGLVGNVRELLQQYKQMVAEFEKLEKLKSGLDNALKGVTDPAKRAEIQGIISDLKDFQGVVHRLGVADARMHFNSEEYKRLVASANAATKAAENQAVAEKENAESMRKAGRAADDLHTKLAKLDISGIRNRGVSAGVDVSALDAAIARMERYQRILAYINEKGGHDPSRITGSVGYRQAANDLNVQAEAVRRLTMEEEKLAGAVNRTTSEFGKQSQVLSDLKSMAMQYLSVWGAQNFINNIIEQGGQLEQQRLSIGAILGDIAHANQLFSQIKGLAVISPFGVTQIDQMSKQLSAYGFQYNELFDLTKRLGDISAATGTDVSRLALALGHVKSEGALSGYTLRQFSMGNVPLLSKLSEKIGVTAKEIRKMVSKKEIGYDEVLEVIKDLTNESGMFYNAQEVMSQALNAKFKNLRDSFQIMYSEMAEGAPGDFLKGIAETLTEMSKNWRVLMPMIIAGVSAFGLWKGVTMAMNYELARSAKLMTGNAIAASKYSVAELRAMVGASRLTLALRGLASALASVGKFLLSPVTLGFAAIEGVIYAWQKHNQEVERARELTEAYATESSEGIRNLRAQLDNFSPEATNMSEQELQQAIDSMAQTLRDYAVNPGEILNFAFMADEAGNIKSLAQQYEYLRAEMQRTQEVYEEMERTSDAIGSAINSTDGGWFDDNVESDLDNYGKALKDLDDKIVNFTADNRSLVSSYLRIVKTLSPAFAEATKNMSSLAEQYKMLLTAPEKYGLPHGSSFSMQMLLGGVDSAKEEAMDEFDDFIRRLKEYYGYDFDSLTKTQSDNIVRQLREWMDKHPGWKLIRKDMEDKLSQELHVDFSITEESKEKAMEEWQQALHNYFTDDAHKINIPIDADSNWDEVRDKLRKRKDELQKSIDAQKPIFIKAGIKLDYSNLPTSIDDLLKNVPAMMRPIVKQAFKTLSNSQNEVAAINQADKDLGGIVAPEKNKKTGSQTDKVLDDWKKRISLLEKYRQELEKLSQLMSREDAEAKLRADGGFGALWGYFANPNDYNASIDQAIKALGTGGKRKEFVEELGGKKTQENMRQWTEDMKDAVSELGRMLSIQKENYDVYKKWLELTGDADLASRVAGVSRNSSYADYLRGEYSRLGGTGSADAFFALSESAAKGRGKGSALFKLWEEWQDNEKKIRQENTALYEEAIKNAKGYADKVADINRELEKEKAAIDKLGGADADRLKANADKNAQEKIAKLTWENFKDTEDWGRIFGNLDKMSTATLNHMLERLREVLPLLRGSVESTKAAYEAVEKMEKALANRSPMSQILASSVMIGRRRSLMNDLKSWNGTMTADSNTAKYYGLDAGKMYSWQEIADLLKSSETDFVQGLQGMSSQFKAVQDVLQPVIDLFDQLGMTGMSTLFQAGSNALGSAVNVASGLNSLGLGSLGPYGAAAAAGLSIVSTILAQHDAGIQKQIDATQDEVDALEANTEAIKTARERTLGYDKGLLRASMASLYNDTTKQVDYFGQEYTVQSAAKQAMREYYTKNGSGSGYTQELANLNDEREKYIKMYDLENGKKKKSQDALDDYQKKIAELDDKIANFTEDLGKELWGIDVKGWADQFSDALTTAWENGEDAAKAFEKTSNDIMKNVLNEMFKLGVLEPALGRLRARLFGGVDSNGNSVKGAFDVNNPEGSAKEVATIIGEEMRSLKTQTSAWQEVYDELYNAFGITDTEATSSASSSIKGMKEQTADLLASYINAVRADVSVNRAMIQQYFPMYYAALTAGNGSLRNIEEQARITAINTDAIKRNTSDISQLMTGLKNKTWKVPVA